MSTEQPDHIDEESPLLRNENIAQQKATPLPKLQLSVLLLLQLVEPICSMCIIPFLPQLVSELDITGGDEKKVGYYVGTIWFCFFLAEAIFVLQWSRLSDRIGRKPVLLTGLAGLCISMTCFGLAKTFVGLVISRSFAGVTNGNIGVLKSLMAEITDSTNLAQACAFMPLVWSIGVTAGPFIGGVLSRPYDRFPSLFGNQFWDEYPYFLPCLFAAVFTAFSFIIALAFLKETVPKKSKRVPSEVHIASGEDSIVEDGPPPLRSLATRPVVLSILNYFALALVDTCWIALLPLFYSTPRRFGGLGLDPPAIGTCIGVFGLANGLIQGVAFPLCIKKLGPQWVFISGMVAYLVIFTIFPIISEIAQAQGLSPLVWALVSVQLLLAVIADMSFGAIFMFITTSVPNKRALGGVNGISQTIASLSRAFGPAAASSLFALSLERHWLGGHAVFFMIIGLTCVCMIPATYLPRHGWKH